MSLTNDKERLNQNKKIIDEIVIIITETLSGLPSSSAEENAINVLIEYLSKCEIDITAIKDAERNTGIN